MSTPLPNEISNKPTRPVAPENTFRLYDGPIIVLGLVLGAGLAIPLVKSGWIPQTLTWQLILTATAEAMVIGVIVWLARRRNVSLTNLVLGRSTGWPLEVCWGLGLAVILIAALICLWFMRVPVSDPLEQVVGQSSLSVRIAFLFLAAVMAPFSEELLYRGVLQSSLVPRVGLVLACLVQAVVFGLMHQRGLTVILAVFVGGAAYGALALWRGCLLSSIVTHASLNGLIAGWVLALFWLNAHTPAATLAEAQQNPSWWDETPVLNIPYKDSAAEQHDVALRYFGSRGLQLRKVQIKAFELVPERFPENADYCARSLEGIQEVYLTYLKDPWRSIVVGKQLLTEYPKQRESNARAVLQIAKANLNLEQWDEARSWLDQAESEYGDVPGILERIERMRTTLTHAQAKSKRT